MGTRGHYRPACPAPSPGRRAGWRLLAAPGLSWLDLLQPCSYRMHMGEVHLPGRDVYIVNEPALVRQVLAGNRPCPRHPALRRALRPLLGEGLFLAEGEDHVAERARWDRALAEARPRAERAARDAAGRLVERLSPAGGARSTRQADRADRVVRDIEPLVREAVAGAMLRLAFGRGADLPAARRLLDDLARFGDRVARQAGPSPLAVVTGSWHAWRAGAAARRVHSVLRGWLPAHDGAADREPPRAVPGEPLVGTWRRLALETGDGAPSPDAGLHQVAMLVLAGHEPTASVLAWSLHLVAHAPRVQQRLHAHAMLDGAPRGGGLAADVVREALRLYPPLGFLPRTCVEPMSLRGKTIEPGDTLVVSPWLIHRHRALWDRPDEFDPDRYSHGLDRPPSSWSSRDAWLPFGLGPRACPGAGVATGLLEVMLTALVRELAFEPPPGAAAIPEARWTLRPAAGVRLVVSPRRPAA